MHKFGTLITMENTMTSINIGREIEDIFKFNKGIKQGDSLSAILSIIALH